MAVTIRGAEYQENLDNDTGLEFYDLSHRWGLGQPCWPYFEDVKIERLHSMAKSGVLTQRITTVMHSGTHIDAPGHVVEGTAFMDEVPLPHFFGTGVVVSIPKDRWEVITADDLENATPAIREGDIVIVNTGWHRHYGDNQTYYAYSPGFYKEAGEWFARRKVKMVGTDTQALDHPLGTAIAPHGPGWPNGLMPHVVRQYEAETGRRVLDDFPEWEPCHRAILSAGHLRHRECRRRHRQGHRHAGHLRRLPVALEEGRRLHRPAGRDGRPFRRLPDRDRGGRVMGGEPLSGRRVA